MYPAFDIFRTDVKGSLLWCSKANTLDEAKAAVQELIRAERSAREFIILNQATQERTIITPSRTAGTGK